MDFALPEEVRMMRATARKFVEREFFPLEKEYLKTEQLDKELIRSILLKAKEEIGLWSLEVPVEDGGAGLGLVATSVCHEEAKRTVIPFMWGGGGDRGLQTRGTPEQKEKYYYPMIQGKIRGTIAYSEVDAGSDLQGIKTHAVRDGDDWVINGSKYWISFGAEADVIKVLCVTDPAKAGRGGMTWFYVEKDDPGFQVARIIPTMGTAFEPTELVFDNVRVPDWRRFGEVGNAFFTAYDELSEHRIWHSAWAIGMADRCLRDCIEYAKQRLTWGQPIATRQGVQFMLADMAMELHAARLMNYHCAWVFDRGESIRNEAFYAKEFGCEMGLRACDRAIQIHGGMGYSRDMPYQLFYRNCRLFLIGHGTSQINRWMIARNLLSGRSPVDLVNPI